MTDVTIRGAGIFGLSIAWACQKRGARVRVIDPNGIAAGSSGGIVGALAPHVPENWNSKKAFQFESLLMAEAFWAEISAHTELPTGYTRAGRLQPIADAHTLDLAVQRSENAKSLWQGQAEWSVITSPPDAWHPLSPTGAWISDTLSAHIHPRRACMALADALTTCGVTIASEGDAKGPTVWATTTSRFIHLVDTIKEEEEEENFERALLVCCVLLSQPVGALSSPHPFTVLKARMRRGARGKGREGQKHMLKDSNVNICIH